MSGYVNVNGQKKSIIEGYASVGGQKKRLTGIYGNKNGSVEPLWLASRKIYLAGDANGKILYSRDGYSWKMSDYEGNAGKKITGFAYGNQTFVGSVNKTDYVSTPKQQDAIILVSKDGKEWSKKVIDTFYCYIVYMSNVVFLGGSFFITIAVNAPNSKKCYVYESQDGTSWSKLFDLDLDISTDDRKMICFGNNVYITGYKLLYPSDGTTYIAGVYFDANEKVLNYDSKTYTAQDTRPNYFSIWQEIYNRKINGVDTLLRRINLLYPPKNIEFHSHNGNISIFDDTLQNTLCGYSSRLGNVEFSNIAPVVSNENLIFVYTGTEYTQSLEAYKYYYRINDSGKMEAISVTENSDKKILFSSVEVKDKSILGGGIWISTGVSNNIYGWPGAMYELSVKDGVHELSEIETGLSFNTITAMFEGGE